MLDFLCEVERLLESWHKDERRTVVQLADETATSVPQAVGVLSDALGRELEVHENLTQDEASKAAKTLRDKLQNQLAQRRRIQEERRARAIRAHDQVMEKVRAQLITKNWRGAYRTLTYFAGQNEKDLPTELLISVCGECLRLGQKADANLQELAQWLRKAVAAFVQGGARESIEEALDFVDAYGDYFLDGQESPGRRLIESVLEDLRDPVLRFDLGGQFDELVKELDVPMPMLTPEAGSWSGETAS